MKHPYRPGALVFLGSSSISDVTGIRSLTDLASLVRFPCGYAMIINGPEFSTTFPEIPFYQFVTSSGLLWVSEVHLKDTRTQRRVDFVFGGSKCFGFGSMFVR